MQPGNRPIATTATVEIGLSKAFVIVVGIFLLVVQLMAFLRTEDLGKESLSFYLPAILGGFLLFYGIWTIRQRGKWTLYPDRLEGHTAAKPKQARVIPLADIKEVDLVQRRFVLRGHDGQVILTDITPSNPDFKGALWLRLQYAGLPQAVWEAFAQALEGPEPDFTRLRRAFIDEDEVAFTDAGIQFEMAGEQCYLPCTDTFRPLKGNREGRPLSTTIQSAGILIRFEPNPALLPVAPFVQAIQTGMPAGPELAEVRDQFLEAHGGNLLTTKVENGWLGECQGWNVELTLMP